MRQEKLSSLCKISNGYAFKSEDYVNQGYRVIRITNVQKGFVVDDDPKFISNEVANKVHHFKLNAGDILVSLTGNVGRVGRVLEQHLPAVLNQRVGLIRRNSLEINERYLFQFLNSDKFEREAIQNSNGVAQLNLSSKWIENYEIPLPQLDDQVRIAHLLGKVEGLITQRKQHLQQLNDLLNSVFLEMFGNPVRNEKGWEKVPLDKLGSVNRGVSKHRPRNDPKLLGGKYPLIQTGEVSNAGTYITTYSQTYSDIGFAQSRQWPVGTLCITIAANIAQTGILTFEACFPDSVVGFIADKNEANPLYVHGLFWFFQAILEKNAPAAAQKNINLEILRGLEVPKPPVLLQNEFASIVEKIEGLKSNYQQSLSDLEALYGTLSQKAFKGELDLSRVPLPEVKIVEMEGEATIHFDAHAELDVAINLPDNEYVRDASNSNEARKNLIGHWLNAYGEQVGSKPFSMQRFLDAAQARIIELHPDSDFELNVKDYELIKKWVFAELNNGTMTQDFNDESNRIELKKRGKNWGAW